MQQRRRRYVVLPITGTVGDVMMAAAFSDGATALRETVLAAVERPLAFLDTTDTDAAADCAETTFDDAEFEFLSQTFPDGPAVVLMTPRARLALIASNPGLKTVLRTKYALPAPAVADIAAARTAGQTARMADGTVFANDMRQQLMAKGSSGADGTGVSIAVLDSGVDAAHPALEEAVPLLRGLIPNEPPTSGGPVDWGPDDLEGAGHGTHVAGLIAARPGHGGPPGVAPGAHVYSYRVFPDNPTGRQGAENAVIIDSIRAAIDDGCHIINLSLEGRSLRDDGIAEAIADAWTQGVICIAAAGNGFRGRGGPVSYPAAHATCVAVSAVGMDGAFPDSPSLQEHVTAERSSLDPKIFFARFSNFGPQVNFAGPGHGIVSTFPGGQWWISSGTSMAAPYVTGMLARLLSQHNHLLGELGTADRSARMLKLMIDAAGRLGLPQRVQEGYGTPT